MAVINKPEVTYVQPARGIGQQVRQRGCLAVVVNVVDRSVITVLLRTQARWTDEDARRRTRQLPA